MNVPDDDEDGEDPPDDCPVKARRIDRGSSKLNRKLGSAGRSSAPSTHLPLHPLADCQEKMNKSILHNFISSSPVDQLLIQRRERERWVLEQKNRKNEGSDLRKNKISSYEDLHSIQWIGICLKMGLNFTLVFILSLSLTSFLNVILTDI